MELTFLGTGTSMGVPLIGCHCEVCTSSNPKDHRLRTSALLSISQTDSKHAGLFSPDCTLAEGETLNVLFDIGPDFRMQMLREGVEEIDLILITHAHRDHVAGLDDIRPLNYVQKSAMQIYLNDTARSFLERDYRYIFSNHLYPGLPEAELHTVGEAFSAAGLHIVPIKAMHKDLPVLGFRLGPMAYITDASHIEDEEIDKLKGVECLVINALRREKHWSHFCLEEALEVVHTIGPRKAFLTHISHEMGLHEKVQPTLPEGVYLAFDGMKQRI